MVFIGLLLLAGFLFGFTRRWWIVFPLAAILPTTSLWAAGAFDDGEGFATMVALAAVLTLAAALGVAASMGMQRVLNAAA